ncbi:MAG: hypothetical protein Q8O19_00360 [Rectinemataceae bacterium]|nr:hypothetical protein [Rectinemataceae bacterium]
MIGIMQNQQNPVATGFNECSHYTSMNNLVGVIQQQSGRACFASDRHYACSDVHCQWRIDCQHMSAYSTVN